MSRSRLPVLQTIPTPDAGLSVTPLEHGFVAVTSPEGYSLSQAALVHPMGATVWVIVSAIVAVGLAHQVGRSLFLLAILLPAFILWYTWIPRGRRYQVSIHQGRLSARTRSESIDLSLHEIHDVRPWAGGLELRLRPNQRVYLHLPQVSVQGRNWLCQQIRAAVARHGVPQDVPGDMRSLRDVADQWRGEA